jgi:hypothetical protein
MAAILTHTFDHGCSHNSEQSRTLEGKALAIASAVAKLAPANGEPTLQLPAEAKDTREGWRPTTSKRLFDALYGQAVRFTIGSAAG